MEFSDNAERYSVRVDGMGELRVRPVNLELWTTPGE